MIVHTFCRTAESNSSTAKLLPVALASVTNGFNQLPDWLKNAKMGAVDQKTKLSEEARFPPHYTHKFAPTSPMVFIGDHHEPEMGGEEAGWVQPLASIGT